MEFLLIGDSKLKIVATAEEMLEYKIDLKSGEVAGQGMRRAFWRILDRAKADVGFDPSGDKVLIQFYPLSSGGCEIFVTKLGILPDSSARLVSRSKRIDVLSRSRSFYSFDSLHDLAALCKIIVRLLSPPPESDVYFDGEKYFLSIEEYGKGGETVEFPCILEFSNGLTADHGIYILEHADLLTSGDAIQRFAAI